MRYAERIYSLTPSDIREAMKLIAANPGTISFAGGLPDPQLFPRKDSGSYEKRRSRDYDR